MAAGPAQRLPCARRSAGRRDRRCDLRAGEQWRGEISAEIIKALSGLVGGGEMDAAESRLLALVDKLERQVTALARPGNGVDPDEALQDFKSH